MAERKAQMRDARVEVVEEAACTKSSRSSVANAGEAAS